MLYILKKAPNKHKVEILELSMSDAANLTRLEAHFNEIANSILTRTEIPWGLNPLDSSKIFSVSVDLSNNQTVKMFLDNDQDDALSSHTATNINLNEVKAIVHFDAADPERKLFIQIPNINKAMNEYKFFFSGTWELSEALNIVPVKNYLDAIIVPNLADLRNSKVLFYKPQDFCILDVRNCCRIVKDQDIASTIERKTDKIQNVPQNLIGRHNRRKLNILINKLEDSAYLQRIIQHYPEINQFLDPNGHIVFPTTENEFNELLDILIDNNGKTNILQEPITRA